MTIKERVQEVFNKFNVNLTAEEVVRVDMAEAALENGTVIYTDGEDFAEGEEAYIINDEGERIPLPPGDYTLADGGVISIGNLGKVNKVTKPQGGDAKNEGKPDAKGIDGKPNIDSTKPTKRKEAPAAPPARDPAPSDPPKKKKKLASEEEQQNDMKVQLNQEEVLAVLVEKFPDLGEELAEAIAAAVAEVYAEPEVEAEKDEDEEMGYKDKEKEEMTETTEAPEATEEVAEEVAEEVEVEVEVEMSEDKPEKTELESLKEALAQTNAKLEELQKFAAEPGLKHKAPAKKVEKLDLANMTIEERVRALANQLSK